MPADASTTPDTATTIAAVTRINAAVEAAGRVVGAWSLDCWSGVIDAYVTERPDLAAGMAIMRSLGVADPQMHQPVEEGDVAHLVGVLDGGVKLRMALAR